MDDDFIAHTECDHDSDCSGCNDRFFDKCERYDCGNRSVLPYKCDQKVARCTSVRQYRNCKNDHVCTALERLFLCENGLCQNVTDVFDCSYDTVGPVHDCTDKRNCIYLQGLFDCKNGKCAQVRTCSYLAIQSTVKNLYSV